MITYEDGSLALSGTIAGAGDARCSSRREFDGHGEFIAQWSAVATLMAGAVCFNVLFDGTDNGTYSGTLVAHGTGRPPWRHRQRQLYRPARDRGGHLHIGAADMPLPTATVDAAASVAAAGSADRHSPAALSRGYDLVFLIAAGLAIATAILSMLSVQSRP